VAQAFSLRHRQDLLEPCTRKDVQEMRAVVLEALDRIAGMVPLLLLLLLLLLLTPLLPLSWCLLWRLVCSPGVVTKHYLFLLAPHPSKVQFPNSSPHCE
jgi:hypothetical protein